jgi:hypothetical protein
MRRIVLIAAVTLLTSAGCTKEPDKFVMPRLISREECLADLECEDAATKLISSGITFASAYVRGGRITLDSLGISNDQANWFLQEYKYAGFQSTLGNNYYFGEKCTEDCSGHIAGFKWAEYYRIENPNSCRSDSMSFVRGCQIYTEYRDRLALISAIQRGGAL